MNGNVVKPKRSIINGAPVRNTSANKAISGARRVHTSTAPNRVRVASVQHSYTSAGTHSTASSQQTSTTGSTSAKAGTGGGGGVKMKYIVFAVITVLVCAGIGVGVALLLRNNNNSGSNEGGDDAAMSEVVEEENTEEIQRVTDDVMTKYAEVSVEGYQEVNDESFSGKAVVVTVKNHAEETVSLAIEIGAYDAEGNMLDKSSVYAEMIEPGQTHKFNTFVYSSLTPEQLAAATYKVHKAATYEVSGVETETETVENGANGGEEVVDSMEPTEEPVVESNAEVTE